MRTQLPVSVGAGLLAACLAVYPTVGPGIPLAPLLVLAVPALALYLLGLLGVSAEGLTGAIVLLALEYLGSLYLKGVALDPGAPLYAAGLFICAELGWFSLEARAGHRFWLARGFAAGGLALAGAMLGFALVLVALLPLRGGVLITAAGVTATVAISAAIAWLAHNSRQTG